MLIVALVLAVIGLAALVTAVVTGDEVIAWVCIAASVVGVVLLIVDALRERQNRDSAAATATGSGDTENFDAEYPEDPPVSSPGDGTVGGETPHAGTDTA
jgi:hypothetical protein